MFIQSIQRKLTTFYYLLLISSLIFRALCFHHSVRAASVSVLDFGDRTAVPVAVIDGFTDYRSWIELLTDQLKVRDRATVGHR